MLDGDSDPEELQDASGFLARFQQIATPKRHHGLKETPKMVAPTQREQSVAETRRFVHVDIPAASSRHTLEDTYMNACITVKKVLKETLEGNEQAYRVRFEDNSTEVLSLERLLRAPGGDRALERFSSGANSITEGSTSESEIPHSTDMALKRTRFKRKADALSSDDDDVASVRRSRRVRVTRHQPSRSTFSHQEAADNSSEDEVIRPIRHTSRRTGRGKIDADDFESLSVESESESSDSDILRLDSDIDELPRKRKRRQTILRSSHRPKITNLARVGTRKSDRSTRAYNNMEEIDIDNIWRSDSEPRDRPIKPKIANIQEIFVMLPANNAFLQRHMGACETCGQKAGATPLINCQGCTLAYHKGCIGPRTGRKHLVTKVGEDDFVLQCRRCVNSAQKEHAHAPHLGRCQACRETGSGCKPFRKVKTPLQEQREREENNGKDPVAQVSPTLINNAAIVLFRCTKCWRGSHFHHLPNPDQYHVDSELASDAEIAESRSHAYKTTWTCKDCTDAPAEIGGLIAWRSTESEETRPFEMIPEDDKEYLVKWKELSYARSIYMPGAWVWGVAAPVTRVAFAKKAGGPKTRIEDVIPEEYLRIDIVLAVEYSNVIPFRTVEVDKARAKEVKRAFIKYKGLGYEDAVWEIPPSPDEGDRWVDFVTAYNDWIAGQWLSLPMRGPLKARLEKLRAQEFSALEKKKQPDELTGELMKYQLDGLNWIFYQWHQMKNGILADEMGLGKTIQIIAFLQMMVKEEKINCAPFLVVVPNPTCANWRREIKKWAPNLRVVTFFGSAVARDIVKRFELFPALPDDKQSKDIKAHIVVTSYEAASDGENHKFFSRVPWQGLIVDEGQRLKNDQALLHHALKELKVPFRLLLTGTPLQNNARELFNLLQFLDDKLNAEQLEKEYEDMSEAKIRQLHDLIRPFILRRTKAQVLNFLPPMAQIILPVSMSVLQKKTYTSILAQNPELLKALFSRSNDQGQGQTLKAPERASLNNILMQLRKCLAHPFVYSRDIEGTKLTPTVLHRNLVEASSKLQLLELLLPKLKERGHRVLIFSQLLDMLDIVEDFLDGLGLTFNRLDGKVNALEKQKRIDQFNQPDSELFAFLLSTRAGGVGINLATADTVIILDPDWNPHQDIQALSRAHRIGQTKKVLCFQLMTRHSVEEKIMQIGRKKMALDHVVVDQLDADDVEERDLVSILRHGAAELFSDDNKDQEIRYDDFSVEKLLDRSQIEKTKTDKDESAESQFSFARVWANDEFKENTELRAVETAPNTTMWQKILRERERAVAAEAAAKEQALGRGKRARITVDYTLDENRARADDADVDNEVPTDARDKKMDESTKADIHVHLPQPGIRRQIQGDSDTDFQPDEDQSADEDDILPGEAEVDGLIPRPSQQGAAHSPRKMTDIARIPEGVKPTQPAHVRDPKQGTATQPGWRPFKRAVVKPARVPTDQNSIGRSMPPIGPCPACGNFHHQGNCPLKIAGVEYCNLCGLAHYGIARTCPHINSETQVLLMLQALKRSNEPLHLREAATKYLKGLKGSLVQNKRRAREKAEAARSGAVQTNGHGASNYGAADSGPHSDVFGVLKSPPGRQASMGGQDVEDRLRAALSGPGSG